VVLSGKDKGKHGEVTKAMPKDGKVIVSGVNIITRHRKPSQANPQGGLERTEAPLHVSKGCHRGSEDRPPDARPLRDPRRKEGRVARGPGS
jgi:large subunit ribosomal protein L24